MSSFQLCLRLAAATAAVIASTHGVSQAAPVAVSVAPVTLTAASTDGSAQRATAGTASDQATSLVISGRTLRPNGNPVDNVQVTATAVGGGVAASALTYGGVFDLHVDAGSYVVDFEDMSDRFADHSLKVTVSDADRDLGDIALLLRAAEPLSAPEVDGTPRIGATLVAFEGEWDVDGLEYAYQWLRNGKAITGATGDTHRVTAGDLGDKLSVRVVASEPNRAEASATARAVTVKRAQSTVSATAKPARFPATRPGSVVVSVASDVKPVGEVTISERGRMLAADDLTLGDGGKATLKLAKLTAGKHVLTVRFGGSRTVEPSTTTVTVNVTRR